MAVVGNRFATMVERNSHRMVLLLVYAVLEWVLIALLLVNSLFTYFITKFAAFFGLQRPCLWCSRVDHIFESSSADKLCRYSDLLCESHAAEISLLRYCRSHRRLAAATAMCWDCSPGYSERSGGEEKSGLVKCCCCGNEMFRPRFGCDNGGSFRSGDLLEEDCLSSSSMFICYEKEAMEDSKAGSLDIARQGSNGSGDFSGQMLSEVPVLRCHSDEGEFVENIGFSSGTDRLIPVEFGDLGRDSGVTSKVEQHQANESEEKNQDSEMETSEHVFSAEELRALQINVKKAVMTKLNDLPGQEPEPEQEEKQLLSTQVADCEADKDGSSQTEKATERFLPEPTEAKEEKFPATPKSTSLAKESLDESAASELEGADAISTVEQLKAALESERKALSALYAELEEERSASAIAANQTMAMITRLQEEKAAMQMEALQYQRMMEEQSEYDQEALQLLNDLMIKREKEKQDLERELECCRRTILDYEEKQNKTTRSLRRSRNSCDSDDTSIDLNEHSVGNDDNDDTTAVDLEEIALDCVKHISILDDSLTEFEEERLSILDQLKALEEKLVKLGDEDGEFSEDLKLIAAESRPDEEGFESDGGERKLLGSMAKKLLPFLDEAADNSEAEDGGESSPSPASRPELDGEKVAIEDEVDHVYERLQALEADREFLKNCMSSIKKGDKGMDLLEEILQHLRDLRNIELRMRNTNDEALGES